MKKITKESFLMDFNGFNCSYSSYLVLNTTVEAVIDVLNTIGIDENYVGSGHEANGNVGFKILKESPQLIHNITDKLQTIGYADTDWDSTYTVCSKNGNDFDDYVAEWEPGLHYLREEDMEEDDEECWDAFVCITDNTTGTEFHTGAGAVDKETEEYYADMVAKHSGKSIKNKKQSTKKTPKNEEAQIWIIGVSGCEMDDVIISRVCGTEKQVKKYLVNLIKEDKNEGYGRFDYGTTTLKEIEKRDDGSLYGYAVYSRYHNDYVATPEAITPIENLN